jgi:hypothetical protein
MYPQLTKTNQFDNIYSEQKMKEGKVVWIQLTTSSLVKQISCVQALSPPICRVHHYYGS